MNGHIDPLAIGDPGRAAVAVTARPDHRFPFRRGMVLDGVRVTGCSQVDGLEVRAASVRGLAHQYYGTTRQDEFAFLVSGDRRWLVASVADGVSAAEHSHRAAEVVSHAGCRRVAELLGEVEPGDLDWPAILRQLAGDVIACAERELSIVDARTAAAVMAATALFAVVAVDADEHGGRQVHTMSLGDTSAWLLHPDGWLPLRAVKDAGAIVSAVTAAVPRIPRELPPAVLARLEADGVLVLMSDGVGDPLGDGTGEVGARLAEAWRRPPDPLNFAAQVGFARRSFDDDRTALAIWPVRGQSS